MASTLKKHSKKIALAKQLAKIANNTRVKRTKGKVPKGKGKKRKTKKTRTTVYTNILGKTIKLSF